MTAPKSEGHLAFVGKFEFFLRDGQVYRANISSYVAPDGYRAARWECPAEMADRMIDRYRAALSA